MMKSPTQFGWMVSTERIVIVKVSKNVNIWLLVIATQPTQQSTQFLSGNLPFTRKAKLYMPLNGREECDH